MFRDTVTVEDAVTVVSVMESSMQVRFLADIAIAAIPHLYNSVYHVGICQSSFSLMESRSSETLTSHFYSILITKILKLKNLD